MFLMGKFQCFIAMEATKEHAIAQKVWSLYAGPPDWIPYMDDRNMGYSSGGHHVPPVHSSASIVLDDKCITGLTLKFHNPGLRHPAYA